MPANPKYLTTSTWQRFAKISAGFLGGYLVTITLHLALSFWIHHTYVLITSTFSGFILWAVLMVLAFLAKNGWKIWGVYLLITMIFCLVIYFSKMHNPIIS